MRSWFILFTTTFTITTLVLALTSLANPYMVGFDNRYVVFIAITSALLSLFIIMTSKLQRENFFITAIIDILFIFTIVFSTSVIIGIHPISVENVLLTSLLVIFIYIIITLIYYFILTKEAEDMNKKINEWRKKHVDS